MLIHTAQVLAHQRQESLADIEALTTRNARYLFRLNKIEQLVDKLVLF